jgi:hypothetical protein
LTLTLQVWDWLDDRVFSNFVVTAFHHVYGHFLEGSADLFDLTVVEAELFAVHQPFDGEDLAYDAATFCLHIVEVSCQQLWVKNRITLIIITMANYFPQEFE